MHGKLLSSQEAHIEQLLDALAVQVKAAPPAAETVRRLRQAVAQYRMAAQALQDSEQRFRLLVENASDISERMRIEQELREHRDQLALALDAGRAGLSRWDVRTGNVIWDARHYEIFGYEPCSFVPDHQSWRQRAHPEDVERVASEVQECIRQRKEFVGEHRIIWPGGETRWVRTCGRFGYGADGELASMIFVVLDITDLRKAKDDAEAASRAKDQFLAVLSHELRTPLSPVLTTAQLMERDRGLPLEVRESAAMIHRNVELEARLIDDVLDLTRISRGKLELRLTTADLHEQLRHAIQICDSDIRSRQLNLKAQLNASAHHVRGDPARLQQVLWNLLKNAVKFTPPGGGITIRSDNPGGGSVRLAMQDTGMGIDPETLPRLFNAFEQGGRAITRQFGGLGLGLAISKELVSLHGGNLTAYSAGEGKGATFTLEMQTVSSVESVAPELGDRDAGWATPMSGRLLLVEDHADSARTMALLLRSYGFEVVVTDSMAAALEAAQAQDFNLILSDIGLPDGSGLDLMRQLRAMRPIKGIALSGYGTEDDIRRSREAGFLAHLTKPISLERLDEVIREVCQ